MIRRALAALALAVVAGCGAGPYGHARTYVAQGAEAAAAAGAKGYDPVNARRTPGNWVGDKVSLYGVVLRRDDRGGNKVYLTLGLHALEPRNLCENRGEDSCRVTVSDKEFDRVHAVVSISSVEDAAGETSIGPGSLVRVIGSVAERVDPEDQAQEISVAYYRHWPRGFYVTTRAAQFLRR